MCIKEKIQKICIYGKNNTNPYLTLHRVPLTPLATTGSARKPECIMHVQPRCPYLYVS